MNKNGSPDLRFNNNRQIPVVLYGELLIEASEGLNLILQTSSPQVAVGAAKCLEVVKAGIRQIERTGPAKGALRVPSGDLEPFPPPPLAKFGAFSAGVLGRICKFAAVDWIAFLPDWARPMAWGVALGVPMASVMAWLLSGRTLGAVPLLALSVCLCAFMLIFLYIDFQKRDVEVKRHRKQSELDERKEQFRQILVSELKSTPMSRFRFADVVTSSGIETVEAEMVAEEVYGKFMAKVVDDGVITAEERSRLDSLASLLRIDGHSILRIERFAKQERYEKAVEIAAVDGVITEDETRELNELRKSLGLGNEIANI